MMGVPVLPVWYDNALGPKLGRLKPGIPERPGLGVLPDNADNEDAEEAEPSSDLMSLPNDVARLMLGRLNRL